MSRRARRPQPKPPARSPAAMTAPVDLVQAVVEAIARGELDEELAVLGAVLNQRVRLLATARSMRTLASLRVGDRVRINHSAKPNYLHGRAGTVSGWAGQNVVVQLDQPVGRFTTGELRCPALVLEPLAPA
jgi:ribosomal protein L21E